MTNGETQDPQKERIARSLQRNTDMFLASPALQACRDKSLSIDSFNTVALARFCGDAPLLELLLERGIALAGAAGKAGLAQTFQDNLNDECGCKKGASSAPCRSHAAWRYDFTLVLELFEPTPYGAYMSELVRNGSLPEITGALLWLEYSIPREFEIILGYLETKKPDLFAETRQNRKNRTYLCDHIQHDAYRHFPDLMRAIQHARLETAPLLQGIERAARAKAALFAAPQPGGKTKA